MSARVQSRAATPDTRVNQCPVSGSHENSRHGRASQRHCQWPGHGRSGPCSSASGRPGGHTNMPHWQAVCEQPACSCRFVTWR